MRRGYDGTDYEIYLYDIESGATTQITNKRVSGINHLGGVGRQRGVAGLRRLDPSNPADRGDWDIFRYHIPSGGTTNVSANATFDDESPRIEGNRVVWDVERLGGNYEVMQYDLDADIARQNISMNANEDRFPIVSGDLIVWRNHDGENYRLMYARQSEAEVVAKIPVVIKGDVKVEDDESFKLVVDTATIDLVTGTIDAVADDDGTGTIVILNDDGGKDFGDAPVSYGTLAANNGPSHTILRDGAGNPLLAIGSLVDPENDGQPRADALGDDTDLLGADEDGLVSLTSLVAGETLSGLVPGATATLTVDVTNGTGSDAYLSAWIDFNGDGVWADYTDAAGNLISERVIAAELVGDGEFSQEFQVPAGLPAGNTYLRLRLSSSAAGAAQPTGSAPTGQTWYGEVEDHRVRVENGTSSISGWEYEDLNADGVWNNHGSTVFVSPVQLRPFGSGTQVLMSGTDSDGQLRTAVVGNDDLSSDAVDFGFSLDFYGQTYTQFYINNNGNITFGGPLDQFNPAGFPQSTPMVAPFWADVDTRTGAGEVRLNRGLTAGGHAYVQVDWVDVGYFDQTNPGNTDARNAFSLYIQNDPAGDIVIFDYQSMNWTTGDPNGTGGLGGLGAQIGLNAGDGTRSLSLMRPTTLEDLSNLLQTQRYSLRLDPVTGEAVIPEPGMAGIEVYLDLNENDGWDPGEPLTVTMSDDPSTPNVDETGYYRFDGLFPGEYRVRQRITDPDLIPTNPTAKVYLPDGIQELEVQQAWPQIAEGTFTIDDGTGAITFEFDKDGSVVETPARDRHYRGHGTAADVAATMVSAINRAPGLDVVATAAGDVVRLAAKAGATFTVDVSSVTDQLDLITSYGEDGYYQVNLGAGEQFQGANFGNYVKPHIEVSNIAVPEGDSGDTTVEVEVRIKKSFGSTVVVDYHTQDGTAQDGEASEDNDYQGTSGQITIGPQTGPAYGWDSWSIATMNPSGTSASSGEGSGPSVPLPSGPLPAPVPVTGPTKFTDSAGRVYFVDPPAPTLPPSVGGTETVMAPPYPLSQTFALHSNPGASKVIYLDFDGHTTTGTSWNTLWNMTSIVTPAYSLDGSSSFSDIELEQIQRVWERVAEDYVPFDVNVTTEDPGVAALTNSGGGDSQWGMRVVIGPDQAATGAGGIAYLTSFTWNSDTPCFVFNVGETGVAEAASHEVGHTLGLYHDGDSTQEYYPGYGSGPTGWAPIMGVGYYQQLVQWSQGEYPDANNQEDDLAIITTNNGFNYRPDDHGNTLATATRLTGVGHVSGAGIIERGTDVDYFSFNSGGGAVTLDIRPFYRSPNLDISATLYDSSGNAITTSNPTNFLDATFNLNLPAGRYYLSVEGVGKAAGTDPGYTDYGSLGYYSISGTIPAVSSYDVSGEYVVWESPSAAGTEIYLGDTATGAVHRLTNNDTEDFSAKIHALADGSKVYVTWVRHDAAADSQVFLYTFDTATKTGATVQASSDPFSVADPQVSATAAGQAYVTWSADTLTDRDIFVYDGGGRNGADVSDMVYDHGGRNDFDPQISGSRVVWTGNDGKDDEIYLYDAATGSVTQVTNNATADGSAKIDGSNIVWRSLDGGDYDILLYNIDSARPPRSRRTTSTTTRRRFRATTSSGRPTTGSIRPIRPTAATGTSSAITSTRATTNVSANAFFDDLNPQIVNNQVVWESPRLGGDSEILHRDLHAARR